MEPERAIGIGAGTKNSAFEMAIQRPPDSTFHQDIFPRLGQWTHLTSPGKSGRLMRGVVEVWVCQVLAEGFPVHWVDGACRMDPSRLLKILNQMGVPSDECLSRLYVSRGFTLHQLVRQIERLPVEMALTGSPFVFLDGWLMMHSDEQVGDRESRLLFRHKCSILKQMQEKQPRILISSGDSRFRTKREHALQRMQRAHTTNRLHGCLVGPKNAQKLKLYHEKTNQTGYWMHDKSTTLHHFAHDLNIMNNR